MNSFVIPTAVMFVIVSYFVVQFYKYMTAKTVNQKEYDRAMNDLITEVNLLNKSIERNIERNKGQIKEKELE